MFKRDYFQRMIEEAGQVLAQLMGLRAMNRYEELWNTLDEIYASYFPFSRHVVGHTEPSALPDLLVNEYDVSEAHLTVLADLLREEAESWFDQGKWDKGRKLLRAALHLLIYLDEQQPDLYSFDRVRKIDTLRARLSASPFDN